MSRRLTTEIFIARSRAIHGDYYDYSKVVYVNHNTEVCIICPVHGDFLQLPYSHMTVGNGCKQCANIKRGKVLTQDFETYKEEVNRIHNNFYDYSKSVFVKGTVPMEIVCPIHGSFWQTPNAHKVGKGCKSCGHERIADSHRHDYTVFLEKAILKHNSFYTYPDIENTYKDGKTEIPIRCPDHGIFMQKPSIHVRGHGCKKCCHSVSKPEIEVQEFVKSLGIEIENNTRQIIKPKELDIYIPSLKKAIEFNGEWWHYNPKNPECRGDTYHEDKTRRCLELGIELLHIRERDWINDREGVEKQIIELINN